jgi:uncharacterized membrane protein
MKRADVEPLTAHRAILLLSEGAAATVVAAYMVSGSLPVAGIVATHSVLVIAMALRRGRA